MDKKYTITHLGRTLYTDHYSELSDEKCQELVNAYYTKPDFSIVQENLKDIANGSSNIGPVTEYYVKDLMAKVKLASPKWSIEEVLQCNDLIRYFWSRVLASDKVYPKHLPDIKNFESALRVAGGGVAMKPSNYPIKSVDQILKYYNTNNKYYDFSCGWGVRLLGALRNKIEYYGTDPNNLLVDRLKQMAEDYDSINNTNSVYDIRCNGSEVFVQEWENSIGLAFSSPPYFSLEDYKIGNQSYKPGMSYTDWLNNYLKPTLTNIRRYLLDDGYLLINIKNFKTYKLYEDTKKVAEDLDFKYVQTIDLKNKTRPSAKLDLNTDENIMVFTKTDVEPKGIGLFSFG